MQVASTYRRSLNGTTTLAIGHPSRVARRTRCRLTGCHPTAPRCRLLPSEPRRIPLCTADRTSRAVRRRSTSDDLEQTPAQTSPLSPNPTVKYLVLLGLAASCLFLLTSSHMGATFRNSVMSSWLGKSGFVAALSLIFLSEIGDKTFFICAILAMRLGRWISFSGTVLALSFMTVFSVGLGVAFNAIPDAMRTSIPIGKYLSVTLLFFFGIRSIIAGMQSMSSSSEELADAEETVAQSEELKLRQTKEEGFDLRDRLRSVAVVTALIFVAEWGDRSMLTTIALGASQNPLGVALGGIVGHTVAALIAVTGGSLISKVVSESSVHFVSGILFVIFAAATALNWM